MTRLYPPDDDSVGQIHDQLTYLAKIERGRPFATGNAQDLDRGQLADLIEAAFWASLRSNEGRTTRVCLTVAAPESFRDAVTLAIPVPYDESQIVKLAPAVPLGGCLIISESHGKLIIRGFRRSRSGSRDDNITIEISEPGILRVDIGPYQPYAVLSGRSNSIIAGTRTNLAWHLQRVLRKTLPKDDFLETQAVWRECIAIGDLARMIVTDGHGGIILLVPENSGPWCNSLRPFAYRFADPDTTIRDAIRLELKNGVAQAEVIERLWATTVPDEVKTLVIGANKPRSGDIRRSVRATASLAGVDGAIVMTRDTRVLGFGAKISVVGDVAPQVCIFERDRRAGDAAPSPLDDRVGGTRHQSAIRFVDANRDATAVVISQDRRMTVIHWEEQINSVAFVRGVDW